MSGLDISFRISALDDFSSTMKKLQKETKSAFDTVGTLGTAFTAAGAGVAVGLGSAVKTATDFNAQMDRVAAISGATGDQLDDLRQTALDLGASTSKSASEVAVGLEEMAKKGFEVNEVIAAMPGIIAAAEASGEDMALVSNVVASALNSFQLEASEATRVADVMAATANKSSADINDLSYAFKYAAPIANTLGISMENLAAATGIMTDAGLAGEQAGTSLRMALIRLSDPPKAAAKALEGLGVSVKDAEGDMVPFEDIIKQLSESTKDMGNTAKLAALSQIFGAEAASGMLSVIDAGPEKLAKFTDELENSGGSAQKTAEIMKDNLKGSLEELGGAFETLQISIGTALTPTLQKVVEILTNLVNGFNNLSEPMKSFIANATLIASAVLLLGGPFLMLVGFLPNIIAGFSTLMIGIKALGVALSFLMGPIGIAVGAVALIGTALVLAYQKVEWFRTMVDTAWLSIQTAFQTALAFISGIVQTVMTEISGFFNEQLSKVKALWDEHGAFIMGVVTAYLGQVWSTVEMYMGLIKGIFQIVWPIISNIVEVAWEAIKTVVGTAIDIVVGLIDAAMSALEGDWEGAWNAIKGIAEDIWHNIESFFSNIDLMEIGKDIIQGLIDGIGSMAGAVAKKVEEMAGGIKEKVMEILGIHSPSRVMMELGGFTSEGFALGIGKGLSDVAKTANSMANAAIPTVSSSNYRSQSVSTPSSNPSNNSAELIRALRDNSNKPIQLIVQLDGHTIAQATHPYMSQLLGTDMLYEARINGVKGV